ncbi:DNA polymerase I [Hahella sp. KA22]|uniref:DNA polymerase I n=1 Tax=Hahella sp. KA22 TaxID=1628392 RepID=UPI000FDEC8F9|nr:DNA polymerase I [Hahella sp. KA22]AZZ94799.1 DNA polymerase I [Hahella sp. KA22]QAY58173.1 DNA polymerase I [Hahella sp. KA22]
MSKENRSAPVVLVDGSSYLFRAYHVPNLKELRNSKGQPTGAIRGVISMLRKLQKDYPASQVVAVFDAKGKNFRHEMYPDYKANRPPMPEDLACQIEPLYDIVRAMGLPLLIIEGVEADDVIGTLAHEATTKGLDAVISTGDKDMAQLVSPHVTLVNTMTDTTMDREGVVEKFGVPPELIVDYLALIGDTVDNIPGVNKCGPKTAVKWLGEFGSLTHVMERADEVKGKIGESLRSSLEQLPLSKDLATIKTDVELPFTLEEVFPNPVDTEALRTWFTELEFRTWIKDLDASPSAQAATPETSASPAQSVEQDYQVVTEQDQFDHWIKALTDAKTFSFDTETTSLNYMEAEIVGVSFAIEPGKAAYVPVAHDYMGAPEQLERDKVLAALKPLLEDPAYRKIGQNLKYDAHVLANHGVQLNGIAEDTMLESYVLNSTANRHDMDTLASKHLGRDTIHFEDIAGKGAKQLTFNQISLEQAGPYAAEDADITLQLHHALNPKLKKEGRLEQVYREIELPLIPVLMRMEHRGALVDSQRLRTHSQELAERMLELEEEAYEKAGQKFNLGSPKQLQEIFYEKLGFDIIKKTPKGQPSTAEPVLQELAEKYELPRVILEYRGLSKLKSTYTDKLPEMINPRTGRVHTSYQQAVAATGRLSSSDPNLQNIPVRNEQGRRIRQAFIAPKGCKLISADYSQIELRIMAHLSGDEGLLKAFSEGLDVHQATAAEVFNVAFDEVSSEQRRKAKAINFGLIYGMSAFGLARQIHVERGEAQSYIDKYFERYPGVLNYMNRIRAEAQDTGYVETLFGRRLYLSDIRSGNRNLQQAAERTAINAPMQGTAADIIKRAMLAVDAWLEGKDAPPAKMIMQVHDELILEVEESAVESVKEKLTQIMSSAAELNVPLLVEAGAGNNWDEAH